MDAVPAVSPAAPPAATFRDGLGERRQIADRTRTERLEILCLRGELTAVPAFEFALRERVSHLAAFHDASFGHVRSVERLKTPAALAVVSDATPGVRLSELLSYAERANVTFDIDAALAVLRQLVPAVALLHENAPDVAHGAIAPERIVVTPNARIVVVEHVLGSALGELRLSADQYWRQLRIALPGAAAPPFNHRSDVTQLGVVALSLILGRPLRDEESASRLADVVASAWAHSARGGLEPLPAGLRAWLMSALQLDPRHRFETAAEAQAALDRLLGEIDYATPATATFEAFLARHRAAQQTVVPAADAWNDRPGEPVHHTDAVIAPAPKPVDAAPRAKSVEAPAAAPASGRIDTGRPAQTVTPAPSPRAVSFDLPVPPKPAEPAGAASIVRPAPAAVREEFRPATPPPGLLRTSALEDEDEEDDIVMRGQLHHQKKSRWPLAAAGIVVVALAGAGVPAARRYLTPASVPTDGTLTVTTAPAGAQLFIDGVERGTTPVTVTLKPGSHGLEIRGGGAPRTLPITITAGAQLSQYIELPTTVTTAGQLVVRSEPAGARVTIDGVPRGTTPVTVSDLAAGDHIVALESDMGSVKQTVSIEAGNTASLVVPLGSAEGVPVSGWIAVTAPADVQLFENGRLLGSSQSERLMVGAGRHEIEIVNEALGYRATKTVQVSPGKVAPIRVEFPKGTIALNAIPWAEVWADGEKVGDTPIGNLQLSIGAHEFVFRHPDLGEQRHAAMITLKTPARLSVDMRKK